jgi:uncharacterized protein YbjT (DUF2867 family)
MSNEGRENMSKTAVIAGTTGLIGQQLVHLLLHDEDYARVIVFVRKRISLEHDKLEQRIIDFDKLEASVEEGLQGSYVYCVLGSTIKKAGSQEAFRKVDYEYPLSLGRLSAKAGAAQYSIVTAMGANIRSKIFYNQVKGQTETALKELNLSALHIFRPSLLLGDREESRTGEKIASAIAKMLPFIWVGPLAAYKPIHVQTVAQAMISVSRLNEKGVHIYESAEIPRLTGE